MLITGYRRARRSSPVCSLTRLPPLRVGYAVLRMTCAGHILILKPTLHWRWGDFIQGQAAYGIGPGFLIKNPSRPSMKTSRNGIDSTR